jgi:hypothetical protein
MPRKRIDFSRENRPYSYYQRVRILHSMESVLFKIDPRYNYLLRAVMERHNGYAADCPATESFLPGAVDLVNDQITVVGNWPVGRAVSVTSTVAAPVPLVANTVYYVQAFAGGKIKLALTFGGAAINLTGIGAGVHTLYAALSPDIGFEIDRVSSGEGEFYAPVNPELFASPGPIGVGVFAEAAPYTGNPAGFGVNFTATPRKLARPMDSLFISGETIQIRITGQLVNSTTNAALNLPSYVDIMLSGRHYPDNSLPVWARGRA